MEHSSRIESPSCFTPSTGGLRSRAHSGRARRHRWRRAAILGLVERPTRDVDVVALLEGGELRLAKPLPDALVEARDAVAADFGVGDGWLNAGAGDLLQWGLPEGFVQRLTRRDVGSSLVLHLASRLDQIHFKLYAFVDQGLGRHEEDLRSLSPTSDELRAAARWTITQDPSEGFRQELLGALRYLGVEDVDLGD